LLQMEEGKIVKIGGDPDSPLNRGTVCAKGIIQVERLNHPDRGGDGGRRRGLGLY